MPIDPYFGFSADHTPLISGAIKDQRAIDKLRTIAGTDAVDRCVFGSIEWEKNLGRPNGPKMSDHFELLLCHIRIDTDWTLGGSRETNAKFPIVGKWDDDDELVYRVFFVHGRLDQRDYWIEIKFAADTDWDISTFHIVPEVRNFTKSPAPVRLKPFQIKPAIVVDPWKSAGRLAP